ncbi:type II toxin-antitoxin system RelE/ParE family toxin [Chryseobacterium sp. RR2-3-20]|uniref:type II toxin-antitoxin system RelE/ParE family toxin n=1 Tax=Chryseobacterium sp. RR2-3-20 TaxID=2787626 RepID=UPI001AE07116|nr:type II toxin-antitoxin system RelE/ParE family toxin [Chryseobacterium sp. RR2-3-20]
MHLIWSKRAEKDLFIQIGYIAENSPQNAKNLLNEILDFSNDIVNQPYKYEIEPIYNNESVRRAVIYTYKLVYKVYKDKVRILRLFHTKQNPNKI